MSATIVRERRQTTLPKDVLEQAGIGPKDQVEWSFEDGKIVGRKLVPKEPSIAVRTRIVKGRDGLYYAKAPRKVSRKDILAAIREDREAQ